MMHIAGAGPMHVLARTCVGVFVCRCGCMSGRVYVCIIFVYHNVLNNCVCNFPKKTPDPWSVHALGGQTPPLIHSAIQVSSDNRISVQRPSPILLPLQDQRHVALGSGSGSVKTPFILTTILPPLTYIGRSLGNSVFYMYMPLFEYKDEHDESISSAHKIILYVYI